jgi:hemerythrin superfamily protein
MDAITMLKDDHRTVEKLFKRFEQAGDRAYVEKRKLVEEIIEELSTHAAVEEQLFYPVTRATVPAVEDVVLESLEEHHIVKWTLSELEGMDPTDERFEAKVTVLIENVRHHVEEEENEYFPEVRSELGRKALADLGDAMAQARETAPTRPHPRSPDTPPANLVSGLGAGVVDMVGATVSGIAQGGVTAAADVVDRVRGKPRSRPTPTGPRQARTAATAVRGGADDVLDRVIATVRAAKETAAETASSAKSAATGTASSAKSGATQAANTAKSRAAETANAAKSAAARTASTAKSGTTRTANAAKSGTTRTANAAKAGTNGTARTAKSGTTRTANAAKSGTTRTAGAAKAGTARAANTARSGTGRAANAAKSGATRTANTAKSG